MRDPERTDAELLPDGRRLTWYEWGHPEARPVLWCTGAATSGRLGFGLDVIDELGLRLVGVNRPGLADSSPHPEKTLRTWGEDLAHLLRVRRWSDPVVVGFSQGAAFALALGATELVERVAVVSGQDELAAMTHLLPEDIAALVRMAAADAEAFAAQVRERITAEVYLETVRSMNGPRDQAFFGSPEFAPAFAAAVHDAFQQGPDGYARDFVNALRPWPAPPEQVRAPVTLWYGEEDRSPMHSPDHGLTLSRRLPNAERFVLEGEGGALLWTRGAEILRRLVEG